MEALLMKNEMEGLPTQTSSLQVGHQNIIWEKFDRIVALGCERFANRLPKFKQELSRIGILPYVKWNIDYENPFLEILRESLPFKSHDNKRYFRCVYNHYLSVLSAYKDGCSSLLVMEDDIVWLRDTSTLDNWIESMPPDYDLAMLDKNICSGSRNLYIGETGWFPIDGRFNSAGCYALSRKGMKRILEAYERGLTNKLINFDVLFTENALGSDIKRFASFPNLAIQRNNTNSECPAMAEYLIKLRKTGVDMNAYNLSINETAEKICRNAKEGESVNEVLDRIIQEEQDAGISTTPMHTPSPPATGDIAFGGYNLSKRRSTILPRADAGINRTVTVLPRAMNW